MKKYTIEVEPIESKKFPSGKGFISFVSIDGELNCCAGAFESEDQTREVATQKALELINH